MATFGITTNDASIQTLSADRLYVSSQIPSTSGVITGGGGYFYHTGTGASTATSLYKFVVYEDVSGAPGSLLAVADESTITGAVESLYTSTFSGANQISVTAGTSYWIGIAIQDAGTASHAISRQNTANLGLVRNVTYAGGPANPFGTGTLLNGPYDIYITYTESSTVSPSFLLNFI